jgi:ADP-glucose pyrophosphorylase
MLSVGRFPLNLSLLGSDRFPDERAYLASMGIIPDAIDKYQVMSYPFFGYRAYVGTIRSYYAANLDLTSTLPKFNFYHESRPVYTRSRFLFEKG